MCVCGGGGGGGGVGGRGNVSGDKNLLDLGAVHVVTSMVSE